MWSTGSTGLVKMPEIQLGHTLRSHGMQVLRIHMHDWLILLLLVIIDIVLNVIEPFHRYVGKGMMQDLMYPLKGNTVPFWAVPVIAVLLPLLIILIYYIIRRDVYDFHDAILGLLFSVLTTSVITDAIKDGVGRPRPDFFWRCFPDGKGVYNKVTLEVMCNGLKSVIKEGHKSFPIGHSSWSFAGLGFLAWYLGGRIRVFDRRGHVAKLCIVLSPILLAAMLAVSRVDDYWHHWQDVFGGGLLGMVISSFCYLQFFPPPYHTDAVCIVANSMDIGVWSDDAGDENNVLPVPVDQGNDDDDDDDGAQLLAAAQEGLRADEVMSILRKNPCLIRIADPVGDTVVHMASAAGDIVTVQKLIEFMEDLESKEVLTDVNVHGNTALHVALKNGHREVAYHLVKADGQTAWMVNDDGIRPYEMAKKAKYRKVLFVMRLMPHSGGNCSAAFADVEMDLVKRDLMGMNRRSVAEHWDDLHIAIEKGLEDVVMTELERDGKKLLCYRNQQTGENLLHVVVKERNGRGMLKRITKFIITHDLMDVALQGDRVGNTPLHMALYCGDLLLPVARCLVKAAPRAVYQVNHKGVSPLHLAVNLSNQDDDIVKYMLQMISKNCLLASAREILLHPKNANLAQLAVKARSLGTLQTLMDHLPELISTTDEKGWRPLSYASNKGYLEEVTYFLTNFPKSAETFDKDGSLPIHKAIGGGHVSIVQAFSAHCPQALHHIDRKGRSVLHIAVRYARADIFAYLTKETNKMDDSFLNLRDNEGKTFMDYTKNVKH